MALSVLKNIYGPLWPLGLITVATSGTPVGIMSAVDPSSFNAPETASSTSTAEYASASAYDIIIQPTKSVGPIVANTGSIYVVMYPLKTAGSGNKSDSGVIVLTIAQTSGAVHLADAVAGFQSKFNPYNLYLDADNSGDGALVTLLI